MTTVQIHHADPFTGFHDPAARLIHVADFTVPDDTDPAAALEMAYRHSQNLEGSWSRGPWIEDAKNWDYDPRVTVIAPLRRLNGVTYGHRSTSVGDVLQIGARRYAVASFGFNPIPANEAAQ